MARSDEFSVCPIGTFHTDALYPYDVPRQGSLAGDNVGYVRLKENCGFEQALECLDGFSHIWLLFLFDRNAGWRPKIQPPRHVDHKVGAFASRSPYRPNGIGISAVRLLKVNGLELVVSGHDLLDGTPILDIKPYIAYADSFPDASPGWTGEGDSRVFNVVFSLEAETRLQWLEARGVQRLRAFAMDQLASEPLNPRRHRLVETDSGIALAYRTWRLPFSVEKDVVSVHTVFSGYSDGQLAEHDDVYGDKELHRQFNGLFGTT
ncbi:MAG: tRNA (N6-threonylcarbamoyladenosine(37)-N6)-methyltransferase TrmO [Victivallales bacterium]|nr:tRNA (N6-threonylcarbamoyladenosine(37)-N6)-methyltransferase TrmO [Victivallales bacterium]